MTEGTIAKWLKQPGDQVQKGDILLEIETDKATMELEAYEAGVVEKVLVPEGQTVPIGQPIMLIGDGSGVEETGDEESGDRRRRREGRGAGVRRSRAGRLRPRPRRPVGDAPAQAAAEAPASRSRPRPSRSAATATASRPTRRRWRPVAAAARADAGRAPQAAPTPETNGEVRASPMARAVARELGVNLASVQGSGPGGRVIRADVEQAAQGQAPAPAASQRSRRQPRSQRRARPRPRLRHRRPAQAGPDQEVEEIPLSNIRRITGRRMVESLQSAPHFFLTALIDVTDLLALRAQINGQLAEGERRISVNDLVVKACALTLRAVPEVNVSFAGDKILQARSGFTSGSPSRPSAA